jgi:IclR family transcriptional regulator, KDG regulon repressor
MKTVKKALAILDSFTQDLQSQGVTEIAQKLGLHKSTTFYILSTLREEGYITHDANTKKYSLGYKLLDLAGRIYYRRDLKSLSSPILQELSQAIEEDITLNSLIEGKRVCIALVESRRFVRNLVPLGKPFHAHCSAAGKVLMAYLPPKEIDELIARHGLPRFTPNTITLKSRLMAELRRIGEQGYGESRSEFGLEAAALAFPILNGKGEIVAALSIQSTVTRLNDKTRPKFLKEGLRASKNISNLLVQL